MCAGVLGGGAALPPPNPSPAQLIAVGGGGSEGTAAGLLPDLVVIDGGRVAAAEFGVYDD